MATYYCQHGDVSSYLQIDAFHATDTTPTISNVESIITSNEQFIDNYTNHTWHSSRFTGNAVTKEPAVIQEVTTSTVAYRGEMSLEHYPIAAVQNLYVWDGSTYVDYVASGSHTAGSFTDPLSGNYWVDTDNGKIYLKEYATVDVNSAPTGIQAYVSYTYGEASTPADIKDVCILLSCIDVMAMWDNSDAGTVSSETLKERGMDILNLRSRMGRQIPIAKVSRMRSY